LILSGDAMKQLLRLIWLVLLLIQKAIMVVGGCVVAFLIFVEVFLRYVLGSPLFGVEEMILFIAMWLYFMGASYGAYERTHIKADLIHIWVTSPRGHAIVRTISGGITVVLSFILVKWTYPYFVWGLTKGAKSQALLLPMVLSQSAIFFGSILMALYFLVEFIDHLLQALGRPPLLSNPHQQGTAAS
jgi:TRAP-type C4-dicarboxylate transport system permease small subunit